MSSQPIALPFQNILAGENAFYNRPDYLKSTEQDLNSKNHLPTTYSWNTEHKIIRIIKQILSIIIFPIAIYNLFHILAGKVALLPASSPSLMRYPNNHANGSRSKIFLNGEWKYKRVTVEVDGYQIDTMIVGKAATLNNGRWMLASNGCVEKFS